MSVKNVASVKQFLINRFSRLFPTYWFCVTFTFLLQVVCSLYLSQTENISFSRYLGNLTMIQYYLGIPNLDGPYWTMIVELLFYIAIAIIFSLNKLKYIVPFGLVILSILLLSDLLLNAFFAEVCQSLPLTTHFPLFLTGIVFYKIENAENVFKQKAFLYGSVMYGFVMQIMLADDGGRSLEFISLNQYSVMLFCYFFIFILFVNKKMDFIINRPLLFLGKVSFPLYLIHQCSFHI